MTTFARPQAGPGAGPGGSRKGSLLASWLSTTDHKIIGNLYLITSFGFFLIAGLMAMIMRAQLFGPDNHVVSDSQYNELFTMHGTIMLLLLFARDLWIMGLTLSGLGTMLSGVNFVTTIICMRPPGTTMFRMPIFTCPPPRHNFTRIPRIRSERPAFDLHYPHIQTGRTCAPRPTREHPAPCVSIVGSDAIEIRRPASAASACRGPLPARNVGRESACGASLLAPGK